MKLNEMVYDDRIVPNNLRTLILNQGYQPIAACHWQRAMVMILLGKAELVEEYNDMEIRSAHDIFPAPAVLRIPGYSKLGPKHVKFSRENIYMRDEYQCQYCSGKFNRRHLTLDHVLPRSRDGATTWTNITTACLKCNSKKADKTPKEAGMPLLSKPYRPTSRKPSSAAFLNRGLVPDEWKSWLH